MHAEKLMELGSKLKEHRLEKGLEREAIAIKIKVSPKTLYALEEALVDSLPQPIFAKGFARSYAEALGMDLNELTPLINEAFPSEVIDNVNPELSASAREQAITINQTSNAKAVMLVLPLVILLVGGIGFGVYKFFGADIKEVVSLPAVTSQNGNTAAGNNNRQPAAVAPTAPAQTPSPATEPDPAPQTPAEPNREEQAATPAPAPETTVPSPSASADYPSSLVPQSNTRPDSPIPAGTHRVVLFAKYECWIGAEFDDVGRRSFVLDAGQTFALDFKNRLRLTLGNSGGIDMSYDGQPYNLEGRFREAKVVYFPPQ